MIGRNSEARFRPTAQGRDLPRRADQAKIQFAVPDRSLAGISFREKLEHDAISEIARQRQMSLERNALLCPSSKQIAQPGNGRVPSISSHQHARDESFAAVFLFVVEALTPSACFLVSVLNISTATTASSCSHGPGGRLVC